MGDMGDFWRDVNSCGQDRRASNRQSSPKLLEAHGIEYVSKNHGAHLIINNEWDFWPGTGKYKHRKSTKYRRGVFNLIRDIKRRL